MLTEEQFTRVAAYVNGMRDTLTALRSLLAVNQTTLSLIENYFPVALPDKVIDQNFDSLIYWEVSSWYLMGTPDGFFDKGIAHLDDITVLVAIYYYPQCSYALYADIVNHAMLHVKSAEAKKEAKEIKEQYSQIFTNLSEYGWKGFALPELVMRLSPLNDYTLYDRLMGDYVPLLEIVMQTNRQKPQYKFLLADYLHEHRIYLSGQVREHLAECNPGQGQEAERQEQESGAPVHDADSGGDPFELLDSLVGLDGVKQEIKNLYALMVVREARARQGLKNQAVSLHCVLTGHPGTGKTTVARILAGIYKKLGILKTGQLVETDRQGLVASYMGQTAEKTDKVIRQALDGVLFIDEAYTLADGGAEDYGREAIATLLKRMEDYRDRLVVVIAGYPDKMEQFINANPGLQSRFTRYFRFPDYNADELMQIFLGRVARADYELTLEANNFMRAYFSRAVQPGVKDENFGNARFVRNALEAITGYQARRLAQNHHWDEKALKLITLDDVRQLE